MEGSEMLAQWLTGSLFTERWVERQLQAFSSESQPQASPRLRPCQPCHNGSAMAKTLGRRAGRWDRVPWMVHPPGFSRETQLEEKQKQLPLYR